MTDTERVAGIRAGLDGSRILGNNRRRTKRAGLRSSSRASRWAALGAWLDHIRRLACGAAMALSPRLSPAAASAPVTDLVYDDASDALAEHGGAYAHGLEILERGPPPLGNEHECIDVPRS